MNFYEWMTQYKGHNTPRGNLADDMARSESGFPKDGPVEAIASHLKAHGASPHMAAYAAKTKDLIASRAIHILAPA